MLGHSRIQMVLRYAHPTQAHQAKAMEQLEQFNAAQQIAAFEKQQGTQADDAMKAERKVLKCIEEMQQQKRGVATVSLQSAPVLVSVEV